MATTRKAPSVAIVEEIKAASKALAPAVRRLEKALKGFDPATLPVGALVDLLYALRQTAQLPKTLVAPFDDLLGPIEKAVQEHFINTLAVGESSGVQGQLSRVQVTSSDVPVVKPEDWNKFFAYVASTKQWELLQHKVNTEAVRERWKNKKQVKFVGTYTAKKVSCTKLGGK